MKRKTIEKIPYLGAEPCSGEEVRYVAAIALKTLAGEEHLILEIYEKEKLVVPLYRFVYTGKDFGYYCPENETWHAASIMDIFGHVRWHVDHRGDTGQITYISEKDHDRLICFCAAYNCNFYAYNHWWKYLKRLEERILDNKRNQQWQKRQEALGIRCRNMPVLPEHFEKWYRETLFAGTNYLYYRRKRGSAEFYCSCCGISYTCKTRRSDSFEGQFESVLEVPENGKAGKCRSCGAFGIYKPAGRMKTVYGITRTCYVGQAYKGKGAVIRYFSIEKFLHPDSPATFIVTETARRFFEQGARKSHTDYYLHNGWNGRDEWCDQKNGVPVILKPARVYPGTYAELAGTILQYSGLKEYTLKKLEVPAADYMEKYLQCPDLELLSKAGLSKLVDSLVTYDALNILVNPRARNPADKLGIRKEKMGLLVKHSGSNEMLRILKTEKAYGNWTDRQCEEAAELFPDLRQLKTALEHMSLQQFLNRVQKYAGASFETGGACSGALHRLKHTCTTYLDYLQMRRDAGYDLDNSVYAFPRNLGEGHREMVYCKTSNYS